MLVPAIQYKDEIEKQFQRIQYTEKYLWYTGSIDNYDIEVKTEGQSEIRCPKCLTYYDTDGYSTEEFEKDFVICPNCGAEMRGDGRQTIKI